MGWGEEHRSDLDHLKIEEERAAARELAQALRSLAVGYDRLLDEMGELRTKMRTRLAEYDQAMAANARPL